ncbi:MAG: hypothetical protein IJJ30_00105 [Erysipelotrichaceae bacterium]|nr:hypothetical protein [Erysipelotrichaceae bacterium]MBR2552236.1 hypothetical protein [Erysipelotrichaceae bacterium]MBR4122775.1 hypothetical protein [Erysipelotrichaceae bacterium]
MLQNLLILIAFIAIALIIYRSIDRLIDPLLPFRQVRRPVKKAVIVLKGDERYTTGKPDGRSDKDGTPNVKDPFRPDGSGEKPDRHSLPLGV